MLKDAYAKHLNNRRPQSITKFGLDSVFEERLLEIKDERTLDLIQVLAYELLMLRDLNNLMGERIIQLTTPNTACTPTGGGLVQADDESTLPATSG